VSCPNGAAWYGSATMASPQDSPTRKKQKARATRKLAEWRKKQAEKAEAAPAESKKK
jgi:hypothetical protein